VGRRLLFELGSAEPKAAGSATSQHERKQEELEVRRFCDGEAARLEQTDELGAPVTPTMSGERISRAPEARKGRHGDDDPASRPHHARELAERSSVVDMFQNVQRSKEPA
jgi:hypothetical protein